MLKVLSSACRQAQFSAAPSFGPRFVNATQSESPLLRVLNSIKASNRYGNSRSFCSEAGSALASAADDCLSVLVLPIPHKPLFHGFKMPLVVKDSKLLAALSDARKGQVPFAGAFLVKDGPNTDPNVVTGSESEKSIYDLKGKDLFNRLHDVGTLAQIITIEGEQVVLLGDRRIRITEMVDEEPLTVKIDHLKDLPFSKDDDVLKDTTIEVLSTIRYVMKSTTIWREYVDTYTQHIFDFNCPKIADFAAAVSVANKLECQAVLEELDVPKRIQLSMGTLKNEHELNKIQQEKDSKFDFLPSLAEMRQMSQMSRMSRPRRR